MGDEARIIELCGEFDLDPSIFNIVNEKDTVQAGAKAVALVRNGEADVLMKGLIATSDYMKQILNKETGLLPAGSILFSEQPINRATAIRTIKVA